jgi:glycosyltransferase involved in cell wall biosynthesis
MKILWLKSDYLHPTTRGGQIRTLGMLRCLHKRHEIHYVCLDDGANCEGPARFGEYCAEDFPVRHSLPARGSLLFAGQLMCGLVEDMPVAVARYRSNAMKRQVANLLRANDYDCLVCDFLFPAPNVPNLSEAILFQHNVEAVIWKRHAANANNPAARAYLSLQAKRMERYEQTVCRAVKHVVAVSKVDREIFESRYGIRNVSTVSTGVDLDFFKRPDHTEAKAELIFLGSMDWLPNVDGVRFFSEQIYPYIQTQMPECRVALVGRRPDPALQHFAQQYSNMIVTGTVDDVRPWLWGAAVSIVPLRIGGGTRLKIFEAMAAETPVISTTIGAEGLPVENGCHLLIEDDPKEFADACVALIRDESRRRALAAAAWNLVDRHYSWEGVTKEFESTLELHPLQRNRSDRVAVE